MSRKFHERFQIPYDQDEARRRFVNRVENAIYGEFLESEVDDPLGSWDLVSEVATRLGEKYEPGDTIETLTDHDFQRTLEVIEALYDILPDSQLELGSEIKRLMGLAETDLGVRWESGHFVPAGSKLLDAALVNEPLGWLRESGLESTLKPFEKGLAHLLRSERQPELRSDVVTDMYEALEATAKIVTGRDEDLSANREAFISKLRLSSYYREALKGYITYANDFRHAARQKGPKPEITAPETEAFVYMTGLFIRLALQAHRQQGLLS